MRQVISMQVESQVPTLKREAKNGHFSVDIRVTLHLKSCKPTSHTLMTHWKSFPCDKQF